jgi:hydroxymethylpyrimidine/phosphomethylpyrimidine kinase
VRAIEVLSASLVADQLAAVLEDIGVDGIKIGMLGGVGIVEAVVSGLEAASAEVPVVLDPVMISKSGASLLAPEAVAVLRQELLPRATLVTPNLPEAAVLCGLDPASDEVALRDAVSRLEVPVLLKGGHGAGSPVEDVLVNGEQLVVIRNDRQETRNTHGTGCTLSSAIAARLARGEALEIAVRGGVEFVQAAMRGAFDLGRGHGPLDHLVRLEGVDL